MIFKTFDSNVDKISSKWGMFGRSFNDIGTVINSKISTINKNFQATNDLIGSIKNSGDSIWKRLYPDKESLKSQLIDVDSLYPDISDTTASNLLIKLQKEQILVDANKKSWQNYFNGLAEGEKWQIDFVQNTNLQKASLSDVKKAYDSARASALAHNEAIKAQTFSAKAGKVALKALAIAGNMIAFTLITKGIELAAKGLDKLGNASKHASESAKSLSSTMNESINSMSTNVSNLSELNAEYQELSKGVNQLGENINLSTDDYSRYKDIIRQVSTIMPNLTTYFNAQGEKIAFTKGELEDLNKEYEKYIQNEAIKFVTKGDDDGNKIQDILNNYNKNRAYTGFEAFWKSTKNNLGFINADDFTSKEIINELEKLRDAESIEDVLRKLNMNFHRKGDGSPNPEDHGTALKMMVMDELGLSGKSQKEILSMTESDYNALMQRIIAYIDDCNTKIASDMSQVQIALLQEAYSKDSYWALEKDVKNDVTTFLSSIGSDIWDALNIQTDHGFSVFVNKIINSMANNTEGFADAWNNLFSPELEELSPDEYAKQINDLLKTICDTLGLDKENDVHILKIGLGFGNVDALAQNYNTITKKAAEKFSGVTSQTYGNNPEADLYYEQVLYNLDAFAKENSINTQDEIAFWNQCIEESGTREEAMKKYLASPFAAKGIPTFNDIFALKNAEGNLNTLGQLNERLNNIQTAYKNLTDAMDTYSSTGSITIDQFQAIVEQGDDFLDYLTLEGGQLGVNEQAMYDLAEARIVEMKAQMIQGVIDNVSQIKEEGDEADYLASTNYNLAESYDELAEAKLYAWKAEALANGLSQSTVDNVVRKAQKDINKIKALATNIDLKNLGGNSASSAAKSFTDLLDKELNVLDKKMEAGYIDFNDYIKARLDLIEDYYRQSKLSADEYYSYLEKHYKQELSYRDKVINAVTRRIDKEIDSLEKQKDQIKAYYQTQIDAYEKEKTLLEEKNRERQKEIDLQKAMYELERAKNQRTKLIYSEDKGMHYVADDASIRDAGQEVENAEYELKILEIENEITKLEQARDRETNAIDAMIDKLREYKDQWNDITSAYEEEQEDLIAAQMLGEEWEKDILDTRLDTLNQFKDDYIKIQQAMVDAAYEAAQAMAKQEKIKIGDSSGGGNNGGDSENGYEVIDEKTAKRIGDVFTSKQEAQDFADNLNKNKAASNGIDVSGDKSKWMKEFGNSDIPGYYVKKYAKKYHTGLKQGPVDSHSFDEDFRLVQRTGLGAEDVPAILQQGEAVATPDQIHNLADGLRQSSLPDGILPLSPDHPLLQISRQFVETIQGNRNLLPNASAYVGYHGDIENMTRNAGHIASAPQQVVNQHIVLNCPNVTNQSGVEYIQRELGHLSLRALQESRKH